MPTARDHSLTLWQLRIGASRRRSGSLPKRATVWETRSPSCLPTASEFFGAFYGALTRVCPRARANPRRPSLRNWVSPPTTDRGNPANAEARLLSRGARRTCRAPAPRPLRAAADGCDRRRSCRPFPGWQFGRPAFSADATAFIPAVHLVAAPAIPRDLSSSLTPLLSLLPPSLSHLSLSSALLSRSLHLSPLLSLSLLPFSTFSMPSTVGAAPDTEPTQTSPVFFMMKRERSLGIAGLPGCRQECRRFGRDGGSGELPPELQNRRRSATCCSCLSGAEQFASASAPGPP